MSKSRDPSSAGSQTPKRSGGVASALCAGAALACLGALTPATADAQLMVVSPHPDDDILMSAGVISRTIANGGTVYVVYLTNGDYYGYSYGLTRQDEAVAAEGLLGQPEARLIFLGYPDAGLQAIHDSYTTTGSTFTGNAGMSSTYGVRGLGGKDYHSYAFGSPAAYNAPNVRADLVSVLNTYRPTEIIVTAQADSHTDHSYTSVFLNEALATVQAATPSYNPAIHESIVWPGDTTYNTWPLAADATTYFTQPPNLAGTGLVWTSRSSLDVPATMISPDFNVNLKARAITAHNSQGGTTGYIGKFIHRDEFFWSRRYSGTNRPPIVNAGTDQTVISGTTVALNGTGSSDPDSNPLTYQWRQSAGPTVTLSSTTAASPTFTAPSVGTSTVLAFDLIVRDTVGPSLADTVKVTVNANTSANGTNLALASTATASSQNTGGGQGAAKAIDGVISGYPVDATREWATSGRGVNSWIQLTWTSARTIDKVVLYDRPNLNDQATAGRLTFSTGAAVTVGALDNAGGPTTISFSSRSVTWVRFTVTAVSSTTAAVGLSEFGVYSTGSTTNLAPVASAGANQTVVAGANVTLNGTASYDPENAPLTYEWVQTLGPAVLTATNVASPTFVAPSSTSTQTLTFQLTVRDGVNASSPSTTTVTVTPAQTGATNVAPLAAVTASSQNTAEGQGAAAAIDGVIAGYPGDYTKEWATNGGVAGSWIQLTWPSARSIQQVTLYDRPNTNDQVLAGTLTFSDGTSVAVGQLANGGTATPVTFSARSVTWVRFTATSVAPTTENVGLAEIQVY